LINHVGVSIRQPEISFAIKVDAVCIRKQTVTPRFLKLTIAVENQDWRIRCPEDENRSFTIGRYRPKQIPNLLAFRRRDKKCNFVLAIGCLGKCASDRKEGKNIKNFFHANTQSVYLALP